jgi:4-amino-4-deoxy-L-arabinose transferase-like glycosyltransferase
METGEKRGPRDPDSAETPVSRGWTGAALAIALFAIAGRIHNAFAFPPLRDYDGAGHALNAFAFFRGALPDPRSWSGFHPPLSYALGGGLWRLLPDGVPVHASLRLVSAAAGLAALYLVWRVLRREGSTSDAAIVCVVALCAPVFAIATSMMGNETLCMLFATACAARLMTLPTKAGRASMARHALGTGVLAGLAILSKSTGIVVLGAAVVTYALALRRDRRALGATLAVLVGSAALLSAPHYLRLMHITDTGPIGAISGGIGSPDARAAMQVQPPGERRLSDYFSFPPSALVSPFYLEPRLLRSVPGLLYASTWADAHAQFLPPGADRRILRAETATAIGGLLPTALAVAGLFLCLRRPGERRTWLGPGILGAALLLGFAVQAWTVPRYSAVKASYLLPALLPACLALLAGLEGLGARTRTIVRIALLGLATACAGLTWYGWWS